MKKKIDPPTPLKVVALPTKTNVRAGVQSCARGVQSCTSGD